MRKRKERPIPAFRAIWRQYRDHDATAVFAFCAKVFLVSSAISGLIERSYIEGIPWVTDISLTQ